MSITFRSKLWSPTHQGGWTFATLPKPASARLGARGRVPVRGTVNGFPFRSSAFPDGKGSHMIQLNAAMRAGGRCAAGDTASFRIEVATDRVRVTVPPALRRALAARAPAHRQWGAITPKARAEWVAWIQSAKRAETRDARVAKAVQRLAQGDKRPSD